MTSAFRGGSACPMPKVTNGIQTTGFRAYFDVIGVILACHKISRLKRKTVKLNHLWQPPPSVVSVSSMSEKTPLMRRRASVGQCASISI